MFTKKADKHKHLYVTNRPMLASLIIDLIAPLTLIGGLVQMVFYPEAWQVTFVAGVVVFGILNHARYDTKLMEDEAELFATVMSSVPEHRMIDVAGMAAVKAFDYSKEQCRNISDKEPAGFCLDMDVNGEKHILLLTTREQFNKMTEGNVKRSAPDLRVIH